MYVCEEIKKRTESNETVDGDQRTKYENHKSEKVIAKTERDYDRNLENQTTSIICFNLENVIALPRVDVSNFFYKLNLKTYNLTAHCSIAKAIYNAIWTEADAWKSGNKIASAFMFI